MGRGAKMLIKVDGGREGDCREGWGMSWLVTVVVARLSGLDRGGGHSEGICGWRGTFKYNALVVLVFVVRVVRGACRCGGDEAYGFVLARSLCTRVVVHDEPVGVSVPLLIDLVEPGLLGQVQR